MNNSRNIQTIAFFLAMIAFPIYGQDTTASHDNRALALVDSIISSQASVQSVSCKYHHKYWLNNVGPAEFQGFIAYKAPTKILMHFLFPAEEYVLVDDSILLVYNVKNEYGISYNKKCLSSAENQIAEQVGQIRMNLLSTMRSSYFFTYVDTSDATNMIIAATPQSGWKSLGKITITLDSQKRVMKSIELFDKNGPLVSSTKYSDFIPITSAGGYYPRSITILLNAGDMKRKDIITYTQLQFNNKLSDNSFTIPVSKNAKIVNNTESCKVKSN